MAGNFVHNDTNPQATIGRADRPWYAFYADDYYGDISETTGINEDIQDELDLKAPLASPELTGTPKAPTAAAGTTTTQIATTAFVANAIASGGGTGTRCLFFGLMSATPTQSLTGLSDWVNQGIATVADTNAGIQLSSDSHGASDSIAMLVKNVPVSTPYNITALITRTAVRGNWPDVLFGWRDSSTGKLQLADFNSPTSVTGMQLQIITYSSPTAYVAQQAVTVLYTPYVWLRLNDDGTNVKFKFSLDGLSWVTLYSVAKSSGYLGTNGYNQIVFGINAYSYEVNGMLMSYAES